MSFSAANAVVLEIGEAYVKLNLRGAQISPLTLTPEEAKDLGKKLIRYAELSASLTPSVADKGDPLDDH